MQLPNDATPEEIELYNFLVFNEDTVDNTQIYLLLEDPIDKFLFCYVFEAGNTRKQAERAIGLSKATIWKRIKAMKVILRRYYESNHLIEKIDNI